MGFLADIIRAISGIVSQAVEAELKSVCRIIRCLCYWCAWVAFAILLMLLGVVFTALGVCSLLEPSMGKGPAAIVVGGIMLLIGVVVISLTKACREK